MQKLFVQLNVPNSPMKHWYGGASWEMIDYMHKQVLKITQSVVLKGRFVFSSVIMLLLWIINLEFQ
jgi:hypothetical protein